MAFLTFFRVAAGVGAVAILLGLAGCGQTGALYLPSDAEQTDVRTDAGSADPDDADGPPDSSDPDAADKRSNAPGGDNTTP